MEKEFEQYICKNCNKHVFLFHISLPLGTNMALVEQAEDLKKHDCLYCTSCMSSNKNILDVVLNNLKDTRYYKWYYALKLALDNNNDS